MRLAAMFRDMSIRRKLTLISVLSAGAALLLVALLSTLHQWYLSRADLEQATHSQASIVATNSTSALVFNDLQSASQTLEALQNFGNIEFAVLYDKQGKPFAMFVPVGNKPQQPDELPQEERHIFTARYLEVFHPIFFEGERVGTLHVRSSLVPIYQQMAWSVTVIVASALGGLALVLVLIAYLHPAITDPMARLVGLMGEISKEKNYGLRAELKSKDELGALAQGLNDMLVQIQMRETELVRYREHLEEEVAKRTARLTEAQRIAHLGNWEWDVVNNTLEWSDEIYRIYGSTPQEFDATYESFMQAVHPEDRHSVETCVREALELGRPYSIDHRILLPDGMVRHVHEHAEISRNEGGQPVKMLGTVQDITDSKLAEEKIRKQQELTSQIIETIPMRVFWKDRDLRYLGCNTLFAKDAGLTRPEELIGKTDFDMGWKDQAELYRADDRKVMDSNTPKLSYDEPQTTPDGGSIWLRTSKVPLHNETGVSIGLLGVYEDITSYKIMELRVTESEERFRKAFQNSAIGMALVGLDGHWLKVNDSLCQIVGYSEQELLGKTYQDITHPDDLQTDVDFVRQLLAGVLDHYQMEKRYFHKNGHVVWIRLSVSLIRDVEGKPIHFVSQIDDITEDKMLEEQIRKLNEELETKVKERTKQLLAAQDELLRKEKLAVLGQVAGSVGHELRNPLGVMNNAVYFLQTVLSEADETTREYLNIIKEEVAVSERIVSDLLDSVRTKPPRPEAVGLRELLEQTLRKISVPASVSVKLETPENLPPLQVDAQQIHQVFRNLVSNGVEAMPDGGTLEISAVENTPGGSVTVTVRDSGIGMTSEQMEMIFQPLFTTKARGIGLGLVVVKNLTQANGGTVKVESEAGRGTVFTVTLPLDIQV